MNKHARRFDVVVIGGGLAGMMAALAARRLGAEVAILAEGGGALELTSGSIDRLRSGSGPLPDAHPYHRVPLAEALAAFTEVCPDYTARPDGQNWQCVTAVGALRETYLLAPGAAVIDGGPLRIVGIEGLQAFHPGVVAEGLRRALPDIDVTWEWVPGDAGSPVQLARRLEEPAFRAAFARSLGAAKGRCVLLPAILGLERAPAVRADLTAALGAPVSEVPLLSPSLPGLRLAGRLSRHLQRAGVELCLGVRAVGAEADGSRVTAVVGRAAAGAVQFRADTFVLATGGLLGGGIAVADRRLVEPVFGLPVTGLGAAPWAVAELLAPDGHAFVKAGIAVDDTLRTPAYANLFVCGKALGGYDPYAEGSGGGVALATGWAAGRRAGGACA